MAERKLRYFTIASPVDRKDTLGMYGGTAIVRLEKILQVEYPVKHWDRYQEIKKLNYYFVLKRKLSRGMGFPTMCYA